MSSSNSIRQPEKTKIVPSSKEDLNDNELLKKELEDLKQKIQDLKTALHDAEEEEDDDKIDELEIEKKELRDRRAEIKNILGGGNSPTRKKKSRDSYKIAPHDERADKYNDAIRKLLLIDEENPEEDRLAQYVNEVNDNYTLRDVRYLRILHAENETLHNIQEIKIYGMGDPSVNVIENNAALKQKTEKISNILNVLSHYSETEKTAPLVAVAKAGNLEDIKLLIEEGGENVNQLGSGGNTPLIMAAWAGREKVVEYLLKCKDIDGTLNFLFTIFM